MRILGFLMDGVNVSLDGIDVRRRKVGLQSLVGELLIEGVDEPTTRGVPTAEEVA